MPASSNFVMGKGKNAGGAITKKRFVKLDDSAADGETVIQCDSAGEAAYGVAVYSVSTAEIAKGKGCSVLTDGRAIVEAGSALPVGTLVATDADGKAVGAASGDAIAGMVDEPALLAGDECSVDLSKSSGGIYVS